MIRMHPSQIQQTVAGTLSHIFQDALLTFEVGGQFVIRHRKLVSLLGDGPMVFLGTGPWFECGYTCALLGPLSFNSRRPNYVGVCQIRCVRLHITIWSNMFLRAQNAANISTYHMYFSAVWFDTEHRHLIWRYPCGRTCTESLRMDDLRPRCHTSCITTLGLRARVCCRTHVTKQVCELFLLPC